MKNIKVGAIGIFDMLKFKNLPKKRMEAINKATDEDINVSFNVNKIAKKLHPQKQNLIIKDIISHSDDVKTFIFVSADKPLAFFKAGQYINITANIGGNEINRPYSLSSSPQLALDGIYELTVKRVSFFSTYIIDNFKIGDDVVASAPYGHFYHNNLRDKQNVVAFAGGIGVTPFYSMAQAIYDGRERFCLTLFYIVKTQKDFIFKEELDKLVSDSFKVIYVTTREKIEGYEYGHITKETLQKYKDYSVFICGNNRMLSGISSISNELGMSAVRYEAFTSAIDTKEDVKTFKLKVYLRDNEYDTVCRNDESLLVALERAGIKSMSSCRSGSCGFCHSKLISGNVLEESKSMRMADKKFGFIHTCSSYPVSDIAIAISITIQ